MAVAENVTSWTRLWRVLVFVVSCLVMSLIWSLSTFVIVSAVLVLFISSIRYAVAQMPFFMSLGILLVVLIWRRNCVMFFGSVSDSGVMVSQVVR